MTVVVVTVAVTKLLVASDVIVEVVLHRYSVREHVKSHCLFKGQQEG